MCECKDNTDRDGGICIDTPNGTSKTGKECTAFCTDSCVAGTEMSVPTCSGTRDRKGNVWGDGALPNAVQKLALSRTNAFDVQDPEPFQISGTGPQKEQSAAARPANPLLSGMPNSLPRSPGRGVQRSGLYSATDSTGCRVS